jgi:hypothetical protein
LHDHLTHIRYILDQLKSAGFTANMEKCSFGKTSVNYLGFIITPNGVQIDPEKISGLTAYPRPNSPKRVKSFLGFCGWYRHFIPNMSEISEPLTRLLTKTEKFTWTEIHQKAFEQLKETIANSVTLAYPDFKRPFILRTDASDVGVGCVLAHKSHDGLERPIAFASRSLSKTERNYHASERECLAIVWSLKKFEHYLDGQVFDLERDNRALVWLNSMKDVNSKFMRWALKIQDFQACIRHIPGKTNVVADAISRATTNPPEDKSVMGPLSCLPSNFIQNEGIIYKLPPSGVKIPFIPSSLRQSVLQYFHDSPQSGHMGYRKTLERLLRRVFWFHLHDDVFSHVKSCHTCQLNKNPTTQPHGQLKSHVTQGPWDTLCIDFMGPLPLTKNRNTQLLVVVDHFTKWVELFALPDAKADRLCRILEREVFCRWGSPKNILTDNAKNFTGPVLRKLCTTWNVNHKFTTTYHPQTNFAERVNRNIRSILSSYLNEKHAKWDEFLPSTALALRTAVSDTMGFSPAMLNLGRELQLPFDRSLDDSSDDFSSRSNFQSELVNKLQTVYEKAKVSMNKSHLSQSKYYDTKHKMISFKIGDLVLLKSHFLSSKIKRFNKKFADRWTGPFKVIEVLSSLTYRLDIPNSDFTVHNIKNLKPYYDRPNNSDGFQVETDGSKPSPTTHTRSVRAQSPDIADGPAGSA